MKKIISLLVACAMLFAFLAACDSEPNPEISRKDPNAAFPTPYMDEKEQTAGDTIPSDFRYSHLEDGIVIERYIGSETIVEIPAQIGNRAFYSCNHLRGVYYTGNAPALGENV